MTAVTLFYFSQVTKYYQWNFEKKFISEKNVDVDHSGYKLNLAGISCVHYAVDGICDDLIQSDEVQQLC